jgi:hypothetical protein
MAETHLKARLGAFIGESAECRLQSQALPGRAGSKPPRVSSSRTWHSGVVTVGKKKPDPQDSITQLSQYRARLARGQRARRADEIFAEPDPPAAIRALPTDEFFYLVHEMGFPEAMEVLVHGTAEQIQTILDLSIWDQDRVSIDKADDWLAALVEAPPATLGRWAEGVDVELVALLVRRRARIYDLSAEEAPENPEGVLWDSPDRLFSIDLLGDSDHVRVTQRLLDSLYRYSPTLMRKLLVGIRAETDADLEETALRWRSGRMADLGFVDYFEALGVYQELDPASVGLGDAPAPRVRPAGEPADADHLRLPSLMAEKLSGRTPFARAVASLQTREEVAEVHFALVALCNRALSAHRATPSDDEAIRAVLGRVSATLDLAVEFQARGDIERERATIRTVPLIRLHRLGVSLIGKLRRLALALRRGNPFASLAPALDIFTNEDSHVLQSLARQHPVFPRLLDNPPAAGERPFASLVDLAEASRAVERAAAAVELLRGLGVEPAQLSPDSLADMGKSLGWDGAKDSLDPTAIDTDVVARTVLVRRLLELPAVPLAPIPREVVLRFKLSFNKGTQLTEIATKQIFEALQSAGRGGRLEGAALEVATRWVQGMCPLGPVLGAFGWD